MHIKGGTFGPVATNTYVVADRPGGSAAIVDPALGSEKWVEQTLARMNVTPVAVIDTHGHWDHVVDNYLWTERGLPVWAHPADADWIAAPAPFNPALFGNPPPVPGADIAIELTEGTTVSVGDLELKVLETPGHSPGCIVLLDEDSGLSIVGDLVFAQGIGRTDFPRSDPEAMVRSLDRVFAELPGETPIHPGHGPWGTTLAEAERFARMFM